MKMIVGLGNPGTKYAATRHNIGFILVDVIADVYGHGWRDKFQSEEQKVSVNGADAILLKPQTFMNLSGNGVLAAAQFYKIPIEDILVIHDELDLAPGQIKLKKGGGHAGHNGLRSIMSQMGADFERMRVGIGHPGDKSQVSNYVLHDFAKSDQGWIARLQENLPRALPYWLEGNSSKFMEALKNGGSKPEKTAPKNTQTQKPSKNPQPSSSSPFDGLKNFFKGD